MKNLLFLLALFLLSCVAPKSVQVKEEVMTLKRIDTIWDWGYQRKAYVWVDEKGIEYFDPMPLYYHELGDTVVRMVNR